ncbi:MAG TPA: TCR/Tet family MFS transporter [Polyangiaceae bacterium]
MNRSLIVLYAAVCLDAVGIGLVFPILPRLIEDVTHTSNVAPQLGVMASLYAVMQFAFAPVLGALSDKIGRRAVLLLSLLGAVVNYLVMATASTLPLLLLGRALTGATSANVSVATAYLTDVSVPEERPRRFGLSSAMFGVGFIIGPILGGVLGDKWLRLPFVVAAALNTLNLLLALFLLPESRPPTRQKIALAVLNPLRPLRFLLESRAILPFVIVFFLLSGAGEAYGTCWALWGSATFQWSSRAVGFSLGTFGVCQTLVQAFLPGPASKLFGERRALLVGLMCASVGLFVMAFARQGWLIFAVMPLFALGGIGVPALQASATRLVNPTRQGELQGVIASVVSLASIVAPLGFSTFYFLVQQDWPGAVWLAVVVVQGIAVSVVLAGNRTGARAPSERIETAKPSNVVQQ